MEIIRASFLLLITLTIQSCQKKVGCITEMKFDKNLWLKNQQNGCYKDREKMLYDLLDNHKIKGLKYSEIENLLGSAEIVSTSHTKYIAYIITRKTDSTIEKRYSKELIISLNRDSIAQSIMVAKRDKSDQ